MQVIRTTMLGSYWTCAFKSKNEEYAANPANTYHGDLLNVGATSQGDYSKLIEYYTKNINPELSMAYTLGIMLDKIHTTVEKLKEKYKDVFQETKMYHKYDDETRIEGVPDLHYKTDEPDADGVQWHCWDFKCSTHSRYTGNEMRDLNMQTYVYPLMIMNVREVDVVKFTYVIFDKKSGKAKMESRIRTRKDCEEKIKEVMEAYIKSNLFDEYSARENKLCSFCSLKATKCPLYNRKTEMTEGSLFGNP